MGIYLHSLRRLVKNMYSISVMHELKFSQDSNLFKGVIISIMHCLLLIDAIFPDLVGF